MMDIAPWTLLVARPFGLLDLATAGTLLRLLPVASPVVGADTSASS